MLLAILLALIHPAPIERVALDTTSASAPLAYHMYVRGRFDSFGFGGEIRFTVTNGFVTGTYRPDTGGTVTTVHGGSQGTHVWFDIATLGDLHLDGTMQSNGTIKGMGSSTTGSKQWVFTATPLTQSP